MTTWTELLDAMERSLDHYEATLGADMVDPDPHWPVSDPPIEPIPSSHLQRAAELMARNNRVSAEIQQRLDNRPARPQRRDAYGRSPSGVSVLDTSA